MTKYEKEISIMAKNRSIKVVSQSGYNYKAKSIIMSTIFQNYFSSEIYKSMYLKMKKK